MIGFVQIRRAVLAIVAVCTFTACGHGARLDSFMFTPVPVAAYVLDPRWIPADQRELVSITSSGPDAPAVQISAVFVHATNGVHGDTTVLYFHGNGDNIDHFWTRVGLLRDIGYNVLIVDYRGYGTSQGKPSEQGLYADARAALAYLRGRPDISPAHIVLYGYSLGTAIATNLAFEEAAQNRPFPAMILEAPFASVQALIDTSAGGLGIPASDLVDLRFDTIGKIPNIRCPLFVIHGQADNYIDWHNGLAVFNAAHDYKDHEWPLYADHGTIPRQTGAEFTPPQPDRYVQRVAEFYARFVP